MHRLSIKANRCVNDVEVVNMSLFNKLFGKKPDPCGCQSGEQSLAKAPAGKQVRIECIHGDEHTCHRLREMGFCEQSVVEKVAQSGALICKVCDTKVIISKKLAENIIVNDVCQRDKQTVLLSHMTLGQSGVVEGFVGESDDCERIVEMGVTPGETVEVVRYAPLGDPIEIKVRGYNLSIRKQEASFIKVRIS